MGQIKVTKAPIEGLYIIEPTKHGDQRGYFVETYNARDMKEAGLDMVFVQDNQSMSVKGVLRGLHFQIDHPQGKLVRVIRGEVFDVAVDLRKGSPTYGQWFGDILSEENGKQMYLLANSGCLNNCSAHVFHDNLVAHEAEISAMDNGYQFRGVCWDFLSDENNFDKWLQRTNFIRPEDIELYEDLVPAVKLATRVNSSPSRVLNAYVGKRYRGSVMELLEPNHSGIFYPQYIENANFNENFAKQVLTCDKKCEECNFCAEVMREACVKLSDDPSAKV
jgi:dTDP-4-dehydrorhamnose 3,5-epimerase